MHMLQFMHVFINATIFNDLTNQKSDEVCRPVDLSIDQSVSYDTSYLLLLSTEFCGASAALQWGETFEGTYDPTSHDQPVQWLFRCETWAHSRGGSPHNGGGPGYVNNHCCSSKFHHDGRNGRCFFDASGKRSLLTWLDYTHWLDMSIAYLTYRLCFSSNRDRHSNTKMIRGALWMIILTSMTQGSNCMPPRGRGSGGPREARAASAPEWS